MIFKINPSRSQKYLNEKDKLFGFIGWYDLFTKIMLPLIISGVMTNIMNGSFITLFIQFLVFVIISFIFDYFVSRSFQVFLISKIIKPRPVYLKPSELMSWREDDL